jgi:hypothetical protein
MATSKYSSASHIQHGMILHFKRTLSSESTSASEGIFLPKLWSWAKKPASLGHYVATTPDLDCTELFVLHRYSSVGGDGITFIMCDKDGAIWVMKKSHIESKHDATAALQSEASMMVRAWPYELSSRVFVANWNSTPFLCMPLLRIISHHDSAELKAAVRTHIDGLARQGLCHDDLHWRHVACYASTHGQPRIVFIDWARARTDTDEDEARSIMLSALGLF